MGERGDDVLMSEIAVATRKRAPAPGRVGRRPDRDGPRARGLSDELALISEAEASLIIPVAVDCAALRSRYLIP